MTSEPEPRAVEIEWRYVTADELPRYLAEGWQEQPRARREHGGGVAKS